MIDALTHGFAILAGLFNGDVPSLALSRAIGYLCYILLSLSIIAGLLVQTRRFNRQATAVLDLVHQWAGNWTVYTCLTHAVLLAVGSEKLGWVHTLFPSFSGKPGWPVALGIYAFYGFLAVTIGGYLLGAIKGYLWRWTHWLAFPSWLLAFLHALLSSHKGEPAWVFPMHAIFAVAVLGLTIARFIPKRPAHQSA